MRGSKRGGLYWRLALLAALIAAGLVTIDLLLPRSGLPQRISGGSRTQRNGDVALDAPASSKMPQPLDSASLRRNLPHQFSIEPPYEVQDGITFKSGRRVIRMAGVRGVDRDAVCTGEGGTLWAWAAGASSPSQRNPNAKLRLCGGCARSNCNPGELSQRQHRFGESSRSGRLGVAG